MFRNILSNSSEAHQSLPDLAPLHHIKELAYHKAGCLARRPISMAWTLLLSPNISIHLLGNSTHEYLLPCSISPDLS